MALNSQLTSVCSNGFHVLVALNWAVKEEGWVRLEEAPGCFEISTFL